MNSLASKRFEKDDEGSKLCEKDGEGKSVTGIFGDRFIKNSGSLSQMSLLAGCGGGGDVREASFSTPEVASAAARGFCLHRMQRTVQ